MDERQRDREAGIDIGFLGCDPAEIIQPRQAAMFDYKIQVLERRGAVVDISHIECIAIERDDGRALVYVDILDPELLPRLDILIRRLGSQLVALAFPAPFLILELDFLLLVLLRKLLHTS